MKKVFVSLWQEGNGKNHLYFPVPPESFPNQLAGRGTTIDILGAGERTVFEDEKMSTLSFKSFFPAIHDSTYVNSPEGSYLSPQEAIKKLSNWANSEIPLRFYSKEGNVNKTVVITNLEWEEQRFGHIDDVWFTVEFVRYVPPTYRRVQLKPVASGSTTASKTTTTPPKTGVKLPTTHTVKSGESLSIIAKKYYTKADYIKVYNANKKLIDSANYKAKSKNKYTIYPGQKLTIPK